MTTKTKLDHASVIAAALSALVGAALGQTYISRLPNHAGYFLVPVADEVRGPLPVRPRHTAFILVDGLRRDAAETMAVTRELARHGQCRVSDQGSYTVSRPEYALLSTGLEVDRSGARNNDLTAPLAAESIWQVARTSGLRVAGSSHLPWFEQLFPDGFDRFSVARSHGEDVFAVPELADVNVFHPLYVDEAGHHHGGASREYADAVARVDREIGRLLARLDLDRDLVVLTADHGHSDRGGHGGAQPEIAQVLSCFAGLNVERESGRAAFDGRNTAPTMAVLLGLRFPRHMRAGEDGLDAIWEVTDEGIGAAYLEDRRAAVTRFREENRRALEGWLGGAPGTWSRLYAREDRARLPRLASVAAILGVLFGAHLGSVRKRSGRRAAVTSAAWAASVPPTIWLAHHAVLGDFDYSVINLKERFLARAFVATFLAALTAGAAHRIVDCEGHRVARDFVAVTILLVAASLGHVLVYGWPLGFPLPPTAARYLPFFASIATVGFGLVALVLAVVLPTRTSRAPSTRGTARRS